MGWPWGIDRETLLIYPYPGHKDAWRVDPVKSYLRMILSRGGKVVVLAGKERIAISGDIAVIGTEEEFEKLLA